ncbi:hypothetical protein [Sphingomonas sp. 28-63-12]|uniref:hypothetical protein n=1 Tax=Sphingomonas sp. 28-63-12 TaxID=1970434 RepID=UPI000BD57C63|nr:MAG: hypothetical protein B7Y47_03840 [Sphingomonas sp. 28-63-12]
MASTTVGIGAFPAHRQGDRRAILICVVVIWAVILTGFGYDMIRTTAAGKSLNYPLIVHAHALAYGGWLVLLGAQVWLMRTGQAALHRRLGMLLLLLWPMMLILGPAVVISLNTAKAVIKPEWLSFKSTQFTNVLGASVLIIAGFLARGDGATHKRLMLMGTIAITEPGFSRVIADPISALLGDGYWQYYLATYVGTLTLMLAVGAYDLISRQRLHPAWIIAFFWVLANECLASWLYYQPFWLGWMRELTGH